MEWYFQMAPHAAPAEDTEAAEGGAVQKDWNQLQSLPSGQAEGDGQLRSRTPDEAAGRDSHPEMRSETKTLLPCC